MTQELPQHPKVDRFDENRESNGHAHYQTAETSDGGDSKALSSRGNRLAKVVGPDGKIISVANLPPPDTKRWVIRRKAEVVAAVRGGLISLDEACQRYTLSVEEFLSWQRAIESFGLSGLRTTRLQRYRAGNKDGNA